MNAKKVVFRLFIFILLFSPVIFSGCLRKEAFVPYNMTLEVWGVFDDSDAFSEINNLYREINPPNKRYPL